MPYTIAYRIRNCWMLLGLDSAIKWQSAGDIVAVLLLLLLQLVIVVVVVVVICHRNSVANCSSVKEGEGSQGGRGWQMGHSRGKLHMWALQWLLHFLIPADERQLQVAILGCCWCSSSSASISPSSPLPSLSVVEGDVIVSSCRPSAAFSLLCLLKIYAVYATPTALSPHPNQGTDSPPAAWAALAADDDVANEAWSSCLEQNQALKRILYPSSSYLLNLIELH